ncbi:MAG: four-helix bundle copper-binding protein [Chloroflexota bacterium]
MTTARDMIASHPLQSKIDESLIDACVAACFDCVQASTTCADACLAEESHAELVRCIRLDQDCADIAGATGQIMARQTESDWTLIRAQVQTCVLACRTSASECEKHAAHHEHCRACAEVGRRCEAACTAVLTATLSMESPVSADTASEQSFPASDAPSTDGSIGRGSNRAV